MGLLDDAIREHLDLKRRRGADPTEVEREEREVLGPVRPRVQASGDEFAPDDDLEYEPIAQDDDPWDDRHVAATAEVEPSAPSRAFDHEAVAPPEPEPYAGFQSEPEPEPEPEPYAGFQSEPEPEPGAYAGFPSEPEPEAPAGFPSEPESYRAEPPPEPSDEEQSTVEYSVEEEVEEEEKPPPPEGDEDVLEETPDFLQDTPDHDRLWFEQRPPRDFDFDG